MELGIFQGAALGAAGDYPWREFSQKTKELQEVTNQSLRKYGYAPIDADGMLGPATCGARKQLKEHIPGMTWPETCEDFTAPRKAAVPSPKIPGGASSAQPLAYKAPSRFPWVPVLAIAGGLVVAGGVYWVGSRKGWFG